MLKPCWSPIFVVVFLGLSALVGRPADAKPYAYLIAEGRTVLKLDTDTDSIVSTRTLPPVPMVGSGNWDAYVSGPDNLLFLSYYTSQTRGDVNDFRIAAFDLRTLTFRKDLGVLLKERPDILIPPTGPHFFTVWFDSAADNGQGAQSFTRYDKASLTRLGDLPPAPELAGRYFFSSDGSRLFELVPSPDDNVVRVRDAGTLQVLASINASSFLAAGRWGGSIHDIQGDRLLLVENLKTRDSEPSRYTLFTVRITDTAQSPRIATGTQGRAYLTRQGDRIIFAEKRDILDANGNFVRTESAGRLHVYDVATGAKLGQIPVPIDGEIWAIHPRGDKVYFRLFPAGDQGYTIVVVSLTSFSVVKQLQLPVGALFFVEEGP